jgi:hypothetical protein
MVSPTTASGEYTRPAKKEMVTAFRTAALPQTFADMEGKNVF